MNRSQALPWIGAARAFLSLRWWVVPALGVVLGAYLWELLTYNKDFFGPIQLTGWQVVAVVFLVGPVALTLLWLLSAWIGGNSFSLDWRASLQVDAPSYWPVLLLAIMPMIALLTGHGPSAFQALVVVFVTVVFASSLGLKAWCWTQVARCQSFRPNHTVFVVALAGALCLFLVVVGGLALMGYESYSSWYLDMGLVDQALWNTLQGRFMEYTFYGGVQMSLLADHVEPILIFLVPAYALWSDPRLLLVVRVLAVGLTALPIYGIVLQELGSRFAALCVAVAFLAFPMVIESGIRAGGNIRTEVLALPLLAAALYCLKRESWTAVMFLLLLAMACKEHVSLLVAALGVYLVLERRHWRQGTVLTLLGLTWFVLAIWVFLPWMRGGEASRHFALSLSALGGDEGPAGVIAAIASRPGLLWEAVAARPKLDFLLFLLLGLAFLPLLGGISAVVLPVYGLFLAYPTMPNLGDYHYLVGLPFLLAGAAAGIHRLSSKGLGWLAPLGSAGVPALAVALLSCSLAAGFFWGSGPLSWPFWRQDRSYQYWATHYLPTSHAQHIDQVVEQVPPDVSVIASDHLLIRLSQRAAIYHFFAPPPDPVLKRVDFAVVDLFENHIRTAETRGRERALLRQFLGSSEFSLTRAEDGVLLFERSEGEGLRNQAVVMDSVAPQHSRHSDLGNRLRLLGYDFSPEVLIPGEVYEVSYYWEVLPGFAEPFVVHALSRGQHAGYPTVDYVLVDTFSGPGVEFRVFHLPTYISLRPEQWQPGQVIQETYEFVIPEILPEGPYDWSVGLYAEPEWFGIRTGEAGLVPGTERVAIGELAVRHHE